MRAAVLHEHGEAPACTEFADPEAGDGQVVVDVDVAGVNHLDLAKASGTFYMGPPPLPSVVGSDGVGRLPDGRRVYFDASAPPYGSNAEPALPPPPALRLDGRADARPPARALRPGRGARRCDGGGTRQHGARRLARAHVAL